MSKSSFMQAHGALTGMSRGMNKDSCEPSKTPAGKRSQFAASLSGKKSKKNNFMKMKKKNKKEIK